MAVRLLSIWSWWLLIVMMRTSKYSQPTLFNSGLHFFSFQKHFYVVLRQLFYRMQNACIEQTPNSKLFGCLSCPLDIKCKRTFFSPAGCCVLSWLDCWKTTNFLVNLMFRNDVVSNAIEFNRKSFSRHLNTHGLISDCDKQKPVYIHLIVYLCKFLV